MLGKKPWNYGIEWEKIRFNLEPSPELSYLLGVSYGDGKHMKHQKMSQFAFGLVVKDKDFVEEFRRCACSVVGKKSSRIWQTKRGYYGWAIYSKKLFNFLSKPLEDHNPFIEKYPGMFLRGFFDSEGTITWARNNTNAELCLSITNKEVILYCLDLLKQLNMDFKYYEFNHYRKDIGIRRKMGSGSIVRRKMMYTIATKKMDNIRKFGEIIGFSIKRKHNKLMSIINYRKSCELCGEGFIPMRDKKYCDNCSKTIVRGGSTAYTYAKNLKMPYLSKIKEMEKITRVNVDLDNPRKLSSSLRILKRYGFKNIDIKRSPSGRGYHLEGWHNSDGYTIRDLLLIRALAFDDKFRCYLDAKTGRMRQVLFDHKKKRTISVGELLG